MKWAVILGAAAVVTMAGPAGAQSPTRASFKGIALGTSLAEWRRLPPPAQSLPSVRPLCDGDDGAPATERRSADEIAAGVIHCGYSAPSPYPNWAGGHIGQFEYTAGDFFFLQGSLYRVSVMAVRNAETEISQLLTAAYGRPSVSPAASLSGLGITVQSSMYVWHRGSDFIGMLAPAERIDRLTLDYIDERGARKVRDVGQGAIPLKDRL